ncbi:hypothetical protein BDB01DRAFT_807349 [Pilobolus umbonatus]|nr:hypothetical protein BDB01DRAFT_807349 [Pilobolus umbonatus]
MEHLSVEVFQLITQHLDAKDTYECLLVNKWWYSLFIPLLYQDITPRSEHQLKLFLESMALYPRSKEVGVYVKQLDLFFLTSIHAFRMSSDAEIDFIDALVNCPNIEKLTVNGSSSMMLAVLNRKMPVWKKLKYIVFGWIGLSYSSYIMDWYNKYRSSLVSLNLVLLWNILSEYTPDSLISYLASFPCLEDLCIDIRFAPYNNHPIFHHILNECPRIKHIDFGTTSLHIPTDNSVIKYYTLQNLWLMVQDLHVVDIQYIKHRFPHLKKLELEVNEKVYDMVNVIKALGDLKTMNEFNLKIHGPMDAYNIRAFWRYISHYSMQERVVKKANLMLNVYQHFIALASSKCKNTGIRTVSLSLSGPSDGEIPYDEYLTSIGDNLDELSMSYPSDPFTVDLDVINMNCPVLSKLELYTMRLSTMHQFTFPNHNLTTLSLSQCHISDLTFRNIEIAYPKLHHLSLSMCYLNLEDLKDNTCYFQLPNTGLNSLKIVYNPSCGSCTNVVAMKAVEGAPVRLWHNEYWCQPIIITEAHDIPSVIHLISTKTIKVADWSYTKPLCVFVSSTVEEVHVAVTDLYP